MEQAETATKREIAALRETIAAHVDQASSLVNMYKLLLQRVDEIANKAEKTVIDNTRLRTLLGARDVEIVKLKARIKELGG